MFIKHTDTHMVELGHLTTWEAQGQGLEAPLLYKLDLVGREGAGGHTHILSQPGAV